MDANEAPEVVKYLQRRFPASPIPQASWQAYRKLSEPFSPEQLRAAIDLLAAGRAERWCPNPGQVAHAVAELAVAAPEWDEVRRQLGMMVRAVQAQRAAFVWTCPYGECAGDGIVARGREGSPCRCRPAMIEARRGMAGLSDMVRAWLAEGYVSREHVEQLVTEGDPVREAQTRKAWEAFAARAVRVWLLARMPGGEGLPGIEAAREESERHEIAAGRRGSLALPAAAGADVLAVAGVRCEAVSG